MHPRLPALNNMLVNIVYKKTRTCKQGPVKDRSARRGSPLPPNIFQTTQAIKTKLRRSTKRAREYNFKEGNFYVQLGAGRPQTV